MREDFKDLVPQNHSDRFQDNKSLLQLEMINNQFMQTFNVGENFG